MKAILTVCSSFQVVQQIKLKHSLSGPINWLDLQGVTHVMCHEQLPPDGTHPSPGQKLFSFS